MRTRYSEAVAHARIIDRPNGRPDTRVMSCAMLGGQEVLLADTPSGIAAG
jgi:hypothetical protein